MTFSENYYHDKFVEEQKRLLHYLERNPDDKEAEKKVQFINNILKEENKNKRPASWTQWEKGNFFYWPVD